MKKHREWCFFEILYMNINPSQSKYKLSLASSHLELCDPVPLQGKALPEAVCLIPCILEAGLGDGELAVKGGDLSLQLLALTLGSQSDLKGGTGSRLDMGGIGKDQNGK